MLLCFYLYMGSREDAGWRNNDLLGFSKNINHKSKTSDTHTTSVKSSLTYLISFLYIFPSRQKEISPYPSPFSLSPPPLLPPINPHPKPQLLRLSPPLQIPSVSKSNLEISSPNSNPNINFVLPIQFTLKCRIH